MIYRLKILMVFSVVLGLLFLSAPQAKALGELIRLGLSFIGDVRYKEYILDPVVREIARVLLNRTTNSILDKVSVSGRDGNPAFVQDWRDFMLQGQYRGEDIWRGILYIAVNGDPGSNIDPVLCRHIRESPAFQSLQPRPIPNLIQSGINRRVNSNQDYLVATRCDTEVDENFELWMQDFAAGGGWEMWERMIKPQNNVFGAAELTLAELEKQRSIEEKADINEALSGRGFTNVRNRCQSRSPDSGACIIQGEILTPGSILGESVGQTINQNLGWITSTDEFGELLTILLGGFIDRIFEKGLSQRGNLSEDVITNPLPPPPPEIPEVPDFLPPESGDGNGGNGGGQEGPCATQEEIDRFLKDNPGDEHRLSEAFPCP